DGRSMGAAVERRYAARAAEHVAKWGVFLLTGLGPMRSARAARWMQHRLSGTLIPDGLIERLERAADPAAEGERIAVELIEQLAATPGVAGVHVMAPANEDAVPRVIAEARQRLPRRATV